MIIDTWGSQPIPRERRKKSTGYKIAKNSFISFNKTEKSDFARRKLLTSPGYCLESWHE